MNSEIVKELIVIYGIKWNPHDKEDDPARFKIVLHRFISSIIYNILDPKRLKLSTHYDFISFLVCLFNILSIVNIQEHL